MKLACIGNSVVRGAPGPKEKSFCAVLSKITGWEVLNQGVEGQTTYELIARFQRDVIEEKPDMVLILNGPADFTFLGKSPEESSINFFDMAGAAKDAGIFPVLVTPMLTIPEMASVMWLKKENIDYEIINDKLRKLRKILLEGPYATIDLQESYKACGAFVDGLHPTEEGYQFIGEVIASALKEMRLPDSLSD